jgi:outer membrane protein assembly factor BamB
MRRFRVLSLTAITVGMAALGACAQRSQPAAAVPEPVVPVAADSAAREIQPQPAVTEAVPAPAADTAARVDTPPAAGKPDNAVQQVAQRPAAAAQPARTGGSSAADWTQFRGPGGQGVGAGKGMPVSWSGATGIKWKVPLPGPGTSTPIVMGQRIILTSYTGTPEMIKRHLVCLDRATGKQIWSVDVPGRGPEESTIREGHGYASSTPVVDAERIYAFFGRSGIYAFDHSGKQLWRSDVGERTHGWGSAASPILYGNLVIVNASVESDSLIAFDNKTGKEMWRAGGIKESWNTPILVQAPGGKTELVVAIMPKVLGFDPNSGEQLWSCNTDIPWYMVPSMVARDGVVYCIGGRGGGGSLAVRVGGRGDVTASHRVWSQRQGSNVSSPVLSGDYLYWAKDSPAVLFCQEAKTGRVVYEERIDAAGQVYASAVLADGKVYYVGRNGRTFVVPAEPKFEILATNDVGERAMFNSSPAVAGSNLFLRSDKFLYCIGQ